MQQSTEPVWTRPAPPLVVHVIDKLTVGGMENGLVNIINRTPPQTVRHAIVCLRGATDFRDRIARQDVAIHDIGKRQGKDPAAYMRLAGLLRRIRPDIVHTRNLPTVDIAPVAAMAGVPLRVHGEHGRDAVEETGGNRKYNLLRRAASPSVHRYITVSKDIERWLSSSVGIPANKIRQIYNGVDDSRFSPAHAPAAARHLLPAGFAPEDDQVVIGTVGRMWTVKDQATLARAFVDLLDLVPDGRRRLRLALVGDGPLLDECRSVLEAAKVLDLAWMPGARSDIPDILRAFDIFALPSRTEGISNTILEAMASGLPVVASDVGGNPELVVPGRTGALVPPRDPMALARGLAPYVLRPNMRRDQGAAGRLRVETTFSLDAMVRQYLDTYADLLAGRAPATAAPSRPAATPGL